MDKSLWEKAVAFHGHECPGLAIGVRASLLAQELMDLRFSKDEGIVCISENDACGVDGVQALTGCTLGKGNLIFKDRGKMAFSFIDRNKNKSVRFILNDLNENMDREETINFILNGPANEVFSWKEVDIQIPERARIFQSIKCEICGESASENNIRLLEGKKVCLDCYHPYSRNI